MRIVDGESRGQEGWIHYKLMEMTQETKSYVAKLEEKKRINEEKRQAAAKKAMLEKKQAAADALRKEQAYINSLPKLSGPGPSVFVATSMDCARDLQNIVDFGKKNGTGVEFRKKMMELVTLDCAITMKNGTPMVNAAKQGAFVTFRAYESGKEGVALSENVRWP